MVFSDPDNLLSTCSPEIIASTKHECQGTIILIRERHTPKQKLLNYLFLLIDVYIVCPLLQISPINNAILACTTEFTSDNKCKNK